MCRCTEAEHTEATGIACHSQGTMADQPSTQQGRCLCIAIIPRNRRAVALIDQAIFRISTVDLVSSEPRGRAQVFASIAAEVANTTCKTKPRDSDTDVGTGDLFAGDYLGAIVEHKAARQRALNAFEDIKRRD